MTPAQRELARHALGLPNRRARSYRRHFTSAAGNRDHADWLAMVQSGDAYMIEASKVPYGGADLFYLTAQGAGAALETGEQLDADDFPDAAVAA
jgi:hypothetical protein